MNYRSSWKEDLPRVRANILCKGWGTLRDHLAGHRRPREAPCAGVVGPPLDRNVSSRDRGETRVLPARIRVYKRCLLAAGRTDDLGLREKTVPSSRE